MNIKNIKMMWWLLVTMSLMLMNDSLWAANSLSWQVRDNAATRITINDQEGHFQLIHASLKKIEMSVQADHDEWKITLIAPNREDFHVGKYSHLQEYPVDNRAGIYVVHGFTISPAYDMVIKEIKTDEKGNVISLAFDFRMRETYVAVRYQSDVPDDLSDYAQSSKLKSNSIEYRAPGGWPRTVSKRNDDYLTDFSIMGDQLRVLAMDNEYDFKFSAPIGQKLIENNWYENAGEDATSTNAGIDTGYCSRTNGRFIIRELELNNHYEIEHFAVDYEYGCDYYGTQLENTHTYGALRYNSDVPITIAPPADYQAETRILTVPFAINVQDNAKAYQPVRLQFKVKNINPLEVELVSITPANPADFGDIHAPAGSGRSDYYNPRFMIPYIRSETLLGDDKAYSLILQKTTNSAELKVGDTFIFERKMVL